MAATMDALTHTDDNCLTDFLVSEAAYFEWQVDRRLEVACDVVDGGYMSPKDPEVALLRKRVEALHDEFRAVSTSKPWYVRFYRSAINHKGTSIIVAAVLCIVTLYGENWIAHKDDRFNASVDGRINNVLQSPNGVLDRLNEVQKTTNQTNAALQTLQPFIHDVINHQFENVSKLSPQALGERLPAVKNLLAVAREQDVKVEPIITQNLSAKLLKINAGSNGYWPTAAEFLNYRSQTVNPNQRILSSNLPNCTRQNPEHSMILGSTDPHTLIIDPAAYTNCRVVLDSEEDERKINEIIEAQGFLAFYNCLVEYHGGAVQLASSWNPQGKSYTLVDRNGKVISDLHILKAEGPLLRFEDCLFSFSVHDTPPSNGQFLTRTLLAQDARASTYQPPKG
jgi:hypothetical protein